MDQFGRLRPIQGDDWPLTGQRELVHDFHLPRAETGRLTGKVLDGDGRPVPGSAVEGVYMRHVRYRDFEATAGTDGTFGVERVLVPTVMHARTANGTRAGVTRIGPDDGAVAVRVGPLAEVRGRLLDGTGRPVAGGRVRYGVRVYEGEPPHSAFRTCFGGVATSGADGRYVLKGLVTGEEYEVSFEREKDQGPWSRLTTVTPAKAETISLGDARVP